MGKGSFTKEMIIEKAAELFNCLGFAGVSLSDLMAATGLKKGGIYNHFKSKEEIRIKAFEHMVRGLRSEVKRSIADKTRAKDQLKGIIEFFRNYALNPVIKGGCPLLNAMVDADNTDLDFQKSVNHAVDRLLRDIADINSDTFELSIKNPNASEDDPLRIPHEILKEIRELDKESDAILSSIQSLI